MEKPEFLFHGSCRGIDGPLLPRPQHGDINGNFPDGKRDVVFATHDQNLAAIYTLKTGHMLSAGVSEGKSLSIFRDYDGWRKELATTASNVYVLPSASFTNTLGKKDGKPTIEWMSSDTVTPVQAIHHTPETVMQTGAQLFFLDPKIENEMWHYDETKGAGASFINRITAKYNSGSLPESFTTMNLAKELIDAGIMKHLNAETGIKPHQLEKSPYSDVIKEDIDWLKQQMVSKAPSSHLSALAKSHCEKQEPDIAPPSR